MKKISKKLLSLILVVIMIFSMTTVSIVSVSAENVKTYVSEVKVSAGYSIDAAKSALTKDGFTVIGHDMNNKVPSQKTWIYVGYKTTTNPNEAITGLAFYNASNPPDTYVYKDIEYKIESGKVDLNKDAGGDYIYLYYTKNAKTNERITALDAAASTDDYSLWQKDGYKAVVSMTDNLPLSANNGIKGAKPSFLVYQSEDTETYSQKGDNDPLKTVNAVNGITYYDCDHITNSSDFYRNALTTGYNGTSQIELWADVFYSMLKAKGNGWGYRLNEYSFEEGLGTGKSIDMVSALTNGTGNNKTNFSDIWVGSSGVKTTNNVNEVYDQIKHLFDEGPYSDISGSYVVDSELGGTSNFLQESSSDIVYTLCSFADNRAETGHEQTQSVMGMMFYNFEFVPIVGDNQDNITLNYSAISEPINDPDLSYQYIANYGPEKTNGTISFTKNVTESMSNSLENASSETTSFTQGLSGSLNVGKKAWPVNFSVGAEFGFEESFSFSTATGYSTSESTSYDKSYSNGFDIPPYSIASVEQSVTDIERTQQYDCPMALTYDVAFISFGAEMGKENIFYTSCAYETYYYATFGDKETTAVEALANFTSGATSPKGFSVKCHGHDGDFSSYDQNQVNTIVNTSVKSSEYPNTCSNAVNAIKASQPMSYNGGEVKFTGASVTYIDEVYSVLPIQKIKIFSYETAQKDKLVESISIDDTNAHSLNEYYSTVEAYTCVNTEFTGWDPTQGYWVLVDENGDQHPIGKVAISDGVISVKADSKTGEIFITPISNGSSHIQYVINENAFMYYYTDKNNNGAIDEDEKIKDGSYNTDNLIYSKNSDITDENHNGILRIDVTNQAKDNEDSNTKFVISTPEDLCNFADMVNSGKTDEDAVLINDIDMSGITDFTPIGQTPLYYANNPEDGNWGYTGTFDGNGYVIKNLSITGSSTEDTSYGVFGTINGTVKNLGVENFTYEGAGKDSRVGAITGQILENGIVTNCYATSCSINTQIGTLNGVAGGIAGASYGGKIENSYTYDVSITAGRAGGIVGDNESDNADDGRLGKVNNCYTTSDNICNRGEATASVTNVSIERFASGEIAYLLNNEVTDGTQAWYQNIIGDNADKYPVLKNTHSTVHKENNSYTNGILLGDVDGDGAVKKADYELLEKYLKREAVLTPNGVKAGDVNGDGNTGPADLVKVEAYVFKLPNIDTGNTGKYGVNNIPADAVLIGDVDLNGVIDEKDLELLQKAVVDVTILTKSQLQASDIDLNNSINAKDVTQLNIYLDSKSEGVEYTGNIAKYSYKGFDSGIVGEITPTTPDDTTKPQPDNSGATSSTDSNNSNSTTGNGTVQTGDPVNGIFVMMVLLAGLFVVFSLKNKRKD